VAEPADALRSGRSGLKPVGVQISPSALDVGPQGRSARRVRRARTLKTEGVKGRMIAGACARGKSELHRARVPGESRGGAARRRQSRSARATTRESNRDHSAAAFSNGAVRRVKRAILPAAISESAVIRLLAEAGSREQSLQKRPIRSRIERDDHHEQNSAYSPFTPTQSMVPLAQSAERRSVEPKVTGSSPVRHPTKVLRRGAMRIQTSHDYFAGWRSGPLGVSCTR
jgi:hypothetical protein